MPLKYDKTEIAIISHDGKKTEMVQFLNENNSFLDSKNTHLIVTGTARLKVEKAGIKAEKLLS